MKIDIEQVTLPELLALESTETFDKIKFTSVIIVPMPGELHDSGYRCMKFVYLGRDGTVVGASYGGSDVLHLDGIGGYGKDFEAGLNTGMVKVAGWTIDCLPVCGCIRIFARSQLEANGWETSDAEIWATGEKWK